MATNSEFPMDNEGWFKRHITEQLSDLKKGHADMTAAQQSMHRENASRMEAIATSSTQRMEAMGAANTQRMEIMSAAIVKHEQDDSKIFSEIQSDLNSLNIAKRIVFALVGLIVTGVVVALINSVVHK